MLRAFGASSCLQVHSPQTTIREALLFSGRLRFSKGVSSLHAWAASGVKHLAPCPPGLLPCVLLSLLEMSLSTAKGIVLKP